MSLFLKSFLLSIYLLSLAYTFIDKIYLHNVLFIPLLTNQDEALGDYYPNQHGIYSAGNKNEPISYHVKINKNGYRDNSIKVNCDKKILLLGDSMVFGWGLDTENTFSSSLQKKLIENGYCYEVMNFGAHYYTIGDMYTLAKDKLYKIKNVEYVFVNFFSGNDLSDMLMNKNIARYDFKASPNQDLKLRLMTDKVFRFLREKLAFLNLGYNTDQKFSSQYSCVDTPADVVSFRSVCRQDTDNKTDLLFLVEAKLDKKYEYLWDIYVNGVKKIKETLNIEENKFYFSHIPSHRNYKDEIFNVTGNDLNFIDFSKDFKKFDKNTDFMFFGDWHIKENAAKIVADKYFEAIKSSLVK
jgi:hypothetical protein